MKRNQTGIGERIQRVRGQKSRDVFAAEVGVAKMTLQRYEHGEREPDAKFLIAMRKRYEISPLWLLTGEGPMKVAELMSAQQSNVPFDMPRFKLAFETVEEGLRVTGREMASDKKLELITAVYDLFAEDTGEKNKERILRLVKSAA
jgi:transcriptional regulator with XRE-family HTH domain